MIKQFFVSFAVVFGPLLVMMAAYLLCSPSPEGTIGYHVFAMVLAGLLSTWAFAGFWSGPRCAPEWLLVVSVLWNGGLGVAQFMHRPWMLTGEQLFDGAICLLWAGWFLWRILK